jgi:hypothetical protein
LPAATVAQSALEIIRAKVAPSEGNDASADPSSWSCSFSGGLMHLFLHIEVSQRRAGDPAHYRPIGSTTNRSGSHPTSRILTLK